MANLKLSDKVADFCNLIEDCQKSHNYNLKVENDCHAKTQDYLHDIEFGKFTLLEMALKGVEQQKNRIERREAKNSMELFAPIISWLERPESKKAYNQLRNVLGEIRKIEQTQKSRVYTHKYKGGE